MAYEFKLPDLGEGLTEGEIARWLVAEGDVVPVGTVLVVIGDDGAREASNSLLQAEARVQQAPAAQPPGRIQATPLVRRIAQELGVDLASVTATGPGGRVTEADVRGATEASNSLLQAEGRREKVRGVRRQIVEHLTRAHREVPAVTFVEECDFSNVDLRLLLPTVLKATAETLREFPELNARLEGDEIVYLDRYDLGIAVQTAQGLVVPVVRACDRRSIDELRADVDALVEKARAGKLAPEELRGSTFSVTSAGKLGGLFVTPLVNYPEVGILGVHRIGPRAVVDEGAIVARSVGNVSVTFDHRVVDGARAAAFTLAVIDRLQA